jgi:hypothetical protein
MNAKHLAGPVMTPSIFSFGSTPAGYFTGTELKDTELIDGTLFVRVAGLTTGRLGWVREGEPPLRGVWDISYTGVFLGRGKDLKDLEKSFTGLHISLY